MTAQIIDGKHIAQQLRNELAEEIKQNNWKPKLAVIWVGDNEASGVYVRNKQKAAQEVGIDCDIHHLSATVSEQEVIQLIEALNEDPSVNGIIVQLPLPEGLDSYKILETVEKAKDVDAFKTNMTGELWQHKETWTSATPEGVMYLLKTVCPRLSGKYAVVIGRSNIVGKPVAAMLLNEDCTVTITHSKTLHLSELTAQADILIAACGCPKLVKKDWVKKGAIVIDVGLSKVDGHLSGDVDFEEVKQQASAITPVPGGVGPMTIAMLLKNTVEALKKQKGIRK